MGFLTKNIEKKEEMSQRQLLETRYHNARSNLIWVLVFTVINIILLITNSNTYFLFSAFVPYILTDLGMTLCGMYPPEYYEGELAGMEFFGKEVFTVLLSIAVAILVLYLLCWIFSKKNRRGWMIFAAVLFALDTVLMLLLNGIVLDMALDYLFHGWVLGSLFMGITAAGKLKKLPEDDADPEQMADDFCEESFMPGE